MKFSNTIQLSPNFKKSNCSNGWGRSTVYGKRKQMITYIRQFNFSHVTTKHSVTSANCDMGASGACACPLKNCRGWVDEHPSLNQRNFISHHLCYLMSNSQELIGGLSLFLLPSSPMLQWTRGWRPQTHKIQMCPLHPPHTPSNKRSCIHACIWLFRNKGFKNNMTYSSD